MTVHAQEDRAWQEDIYRQEAFEVHHSTQSIVVLFVSHATSATIRSIELINAVGSQGLSSH